MPDDMSGYENIIPEAIKRQSLRAEQLARDAGIANVPELKVEEPAPAAESVETPTVVEIPELGDPTGTARETPGPVIEDDWRQKYLTLEGKYRAEVPQLNSQLRHQQGQIENLQTMLANLPSVPAPKSAEPTGKIPDTDVEAYGEDLVNAARRWARAEIAPELDQLKQQFEQIRGQTQKTETTLSQSTVERGLDAAIPGWRVTNDDPKFLAWLAQVDPFSGQVRHTMLGDAYSRGDVSRTSAFFRAFTNEHTALTPAPRAAPQTADPAAGRPTLESLAAPGRVNAAPGGSGAPEKRVWSRDQITAFYREKQQGKWDGREAEADRMERDLFDASSEGRIR